MTQGGPGATSVYIYYLYANAFSFGRMGYASAMAWLLFAVIALVTFIQWRLQRRWGLLWLTDRKSSKFQGASSKWTGARHLELSTWYLEPRSDRMSTQPIEIIVEPQTSPTLKRSIRVGGLALQYVVMTLLAVAFVLPLVWMISTSLKLESQVLQTPPRFFPNDPQWSNYSDTFGTIKDFLWNSVYLAILNVVLLLFFASAAAYAFARLDFFGRDLAFALLLSTAMVPGIIYLIPQYIIYREIGWIDTHFPLWVPRVTTPVIGTFLLRQFFKSIPAELEDAAKLDGASTFRMYLKMVCPRSNPASRPSASSPFSIHGMTFSAPPHLRQLDRETDPSSGARPLPGRVLHPDKPAHGRRHAHRRTRHPHLPRLPEVLHPGHRPHRAQGLTPRSSKEQVPRSK